MKKKLSYIPAIAIIAVAIGLVKLANEQSAVGKMSNIPPTLDNLKRGIANGWYSAQLTRINGQQAVRLSGKLNNGEYYSDVYPVTNAVANELRSMGVREV